MMSGRLIGSLGFTGVCHHADSQRPSIFLQSMIFGAGQVHLE